MKKVWLICPACGIGKEVTRELSDPPDCAYIVTPCDNIDTCGGYYEHPRYFTAKDEPIEFLYPWSWRK